MTTTEWIDELKTAWVLLFGAATVPKNKQWGYWLVKHEPSTLRMGLARVAKKHLELGGEMDADFMARFMSSVCNRITREAQDRQKAVPWGDPYKAFVFVVERFLDTKGTVADANRALDLLETLRDSPEDFWESYFKQRDPAQRDETSALLRKLGSDATFADLYRLSAKEMV